MNNNNEKGYQDDFQVPTGVTINNTTKESEGYNDTYYDQSYNDNKYNEYEEPKKKFPWKIIIIALLAIIFIFLFWYFLFGKGSSANVNVQYEKLTDDLCSKALTYSEKKEGIIDKETPGATAYVSLQDLVDDYSIPSSAIKDPRYKKSLFSKPEGNEFISFNSYLRLFVMPNGQVSCEGLVDTGEDHTKPILTLKGTTPVKIAKGTNFEDPGAKAVDDVDGDISDKIVRSGTVDILKEGEYKITYSVTDTSGNLSNIDRIIVVEEYKDIEITLGSNFDLITPQIELKGTNPYCMKVGQKYIEPGAIATDNVDGNITNKIKVDSSAVTGNRNGSFRVTYEVSDTYGHRAIAYRSVMVRSECVDKVVIGTPQINNRPQIQLEGATSVTINIYEEYKDRGATAWDKEDGVLKVTLISNTVNTNKAGIYEVVYKATDSGGLSATAKRIVTVKDPNAISNTATFLEVPQSMRIPLGQVQVIPMPQAKDLYGNVLTVTQTIKDSSEAVVASINFYRVETYRIEYFAKPANGVGQAVHRNVTIYDAVAPTITLPANLFVPVRTESCDLSIVDLKAAGMVVSDAPNEVTPEIVVTGGVNKVCALNSNGIDIEVYAKDASGNRSEVKKSKLYIVDKVDGGPPTSVEIGNCGTNGELNMFVGDVTILSAQIYPINANDKTLSWTSALSQYATVDGNGKVTALAKGSTKIIATTTTGGFTSTCNVIVRERITTVGVTGVDIEGCESGTMTLVKGTYKTLKAIVKPTNASNKDVTWDFGTLSSVLFPKCGNVTMDDFQIRANCAAPNTDLYATTDCIHIVEKCMGGSPIIHATELGEKNIKVTTVDGNITKNCLVKVIDGTLDTTPPSKVIVISNNANTVDPYNKNGNWFGGNLGRKIKIVIESTDNESRITKFEVRYPSNPSVIFTVTPEVSSPNRGILYISDSMLSSIEIIAYNEAGLTSMPSDPVLVKLDNDGPTTTYSTWIEDPNTWVSQDKVSVKYQSNDMIAIGPTIKGLTDGTGVKEYQYTHDDVKAKAATDIKIEGTTQAVEMIFNESNINKYVYVRAVDNIGNIGPWTQKPSYLNMDTVAPMPPTLSFLDNSNNTPSVRILFKFTDNASPKMSGFGKYEYFLNNNPGVIKTTETEPLVLASAGSYSMRAWSYDKAGNKSGNYGELTGIVVAQPTAPEQPEQPKPPTPPQCANKYRYIMTNNYTGSNAYSDWSYASAASAKSACESTDKAKETVKKGVCSSTSKVVNNTMYRYRGYDMDMLPKVSQYVYASSTNAINACKSTYSNCSAESKVNSSTKYAFILTEAFTNKTTTSGYTYTSSTDATNACAAQNPSFVYSSVSVVTCSSDPTPKCVY